MRGTIVKLGAFMVVCLVFTGYLAFTIGNIRPFQGTYDLTATFDDVTGLLPNDNVKVAGVVVGKVTGIAVDQGRARVRFTVQKGVRLPSDSTAAVRWRNLLGQRYLYVYPGTSTTRLTDGGHVARTRPVVDLGELFNRLGPIVQAIEPAKVNLFLDTVVGALDGNEANLRAALDDLGTLTQGLAERDAAIQRMIGNLATVSETVADRERQIGAVLDNLVEIARTFSENTDVLERAVVSTADLGDNLTFLLSRNRTELDTILANLVTITNVVEGKLPTLEHTLENLVEGTKRLFNSSRYGDWLNQVIPCGGFFYPNRIEAQAECKVGPPGPPSGSPSAPHGAPITSGAAAVTTLIGGAR